MSSMLLLTRKGESNRPVSGTEGYIRRRNHLDHSKIAVMIESRELPELIPLLLNFLVRIPEEWPIRIYCGRENIEAVSQSRFLRSYIISGKLDVARIPDEPLVCDKAWLSAYLTSTAFWELLAPAEHIFFFQTDSMICSNSHWSLNDFLGLEIYEGGYDMLGAKWPVSLTIFKNDVVNERVL
jgi:hypothetical protein